VRKVDDRVVDGEEVEGVLVLRVVRAEVRRGDRGVEINQRIKVKSIGVTVGVFSREPFFKEASSWQRGLVTVE